MSGLDRIRRAKRRLESLEELDRLMRQPPHGENHGRARTASGKLRNLNVDAWTRQSLGPGFQLLKPERRSTSSRSTRPWNTIRHGTLSGYTNHCSKHPLGPCKACKAAYAAYRRDYRRRNKYR